MQIKDCEIGSCGRAHGAATLAAASTISSPYFQDEKRIGFSRAGTPKKNIVVHRSASDLAARRIAKLLR
jgi:hypothetical protein